MIKYRYVVILSTCFLLSGCGPSQQRFARDCQARASIDVYSRAPWSDYLVQLRDKLVAMNASVRSKEPVSDPPDVNDFLTTDDFEFTNSWVLRGRPEFKTRRIYENDHFVLNRRTGAKVARIGSLHASVPTFETIEGWECIYDYPQLYRKYLTQRR